MSREMGKSLKDEIDTMLLFAYRGEVKRGISKKYFFIMRKTTKKIVLPFVSTPYPDIITSVGVTLKPTLS